MGNQATKGNKNSFLSEEETAFVENSFKVLSGKEEKLKRDVLQSAWNNLVDSELTSHIFSCWFGNGKHSAITIGPYSEHYYVAVKGSLCEKSNYINTKIFGNPSGVEGGITPDNLLKLVSAVVRSYFIILVEHSKTEQYKSWQVSDISVKRHDIDNYSQFLLKDLMNVQPISLDELENWLHLNPLWLQLWKSVVVFLYTHNRQLGNSPLSHPLTLPFCEVPANLGQVPTILDVGKIMFLNDQLPPDLRHKWRLLFNSQIHGESFATFLGKLTNKGPTIIVVEDDQGHMFGGFAPHSWNLGPKFVGNDTAILFTLQPTMQSFMTSGYNDHYQYLNTNQQTMPNGLGMGGQFGYWGFWLDCEYGAGQSSETCTTFKNYVQLSAKKDFKAHNIEVWALGEEPQKEGEEEQHGSILDHNLEEKVVLELAGRQMHSEGLRDPDLDL